MYRLYMEYCRFGDLEDLIDNQKEFVDSCPQDQTGAPIPRWDILHTMTVIVRLLIPPAVHFQPRSYGACLRRWPALFA